MQLAATPPDIPALMTAVKSVFPTHYGSGYTPEMANRAFSAALSGRRAAADVVPVVAAVRQGIPAYGSGYTIDQQLQLTLRALAGPYDAAGVTQVISGVKQAMPAHYGSGYRVEDQISAMDAALGASLCAAPAAA